MEKNISHYKQALEKELALLTDELNTVGKENPEHKGEWEPTSGKMEVDRADENEVADKIDAFEENTGIMNSLETRYNEVRAALDRIANNTFGKCSVCGKDIEEKRLEANPAATTCMADMKK
jgi:DnaK suppressor protein